MYVRGAVLLYRFLKEQSYKCNDVSEHLKPFSSTFLQKLLMLMYSRNPRFLGNPNSA